MAVRVTEHAVVARECPVCKKRRVPKVELGDAVLGRQRVGVNLMSLVASLREEARLPIRTIRWYLRSVHGLELSEGAIVDIVHRVGARAREAWERCWAVSGRARWLGRTRRAGTRTG